MVANQTKSKSWRQDEVNYLVREYKKYTPAKAIAEKLGRTVNSVESKLYSMRKSGELGKALTNLATAGKSKKNTINITMTPVEETVTLSPSVRPKKSVWKKLKDWWNR